MKKDLICPDCKKEMEKGTLMQQGHMWTTAVNENVVKVTETLTGTDYVYAYGCPECGRIELYREIK